MYVVVNDPNNRKATIGFLSRADPGLFWLTCHSNFSSDSTRVSPVALYSVALGKGSVTVVVLVVIRVVGGWREGVMLY